MIITAVTLNDGLGSQLQCNLWTILYAIHHGFTFHYTPIKKIDHNYDNDPEFINRVEDLFNLANTYPIYKEPKSVSYFKQVYSELRKNISIYATPERLKELRNAFWKNKNKNFFNNNKFNVAVHIRRPNSHDNRTKVSTTPDLYYLNIIKSIRSEHKDKDLQFHIYSQGDLNNFEIYKGKTDSNDKKDDTCLHINEEIVSTFIAMVSADILVTSQISFSYSAALLNENIIYYLKFWDPPLNHWRVFNV
jgi:hypothetical protein